MSEERESESLQDDDVSADDLNRLTSLMDDQGEIPPHGERHETDSEGTEDAEQAQNKATERQQTDDSDPQGQTEEIVYDGRKYHVPAELKDAFLRQADYTRKTQETAAERAAAQQERQVAAQLKQEAGQFVEAYATVRSLDSQMQSIANEWQQLVQQGPGNDPIRELQLKQAWTDASRAKDGVIGQIQQTRAQMAYQEQAQLQQLQQMGERYLKERLPDWGSQERKQELANTVIEKYGFKPEELAIFDPRIILAMNDLAEYHKLKSQRTVVQKQVRQAPPKVVRASSNVDRTDAPPRNDHLTRLRKSHADGDAVAALRALGIE